MKKKKEEKSWRKILKKGQIIIWEKDNYIYVDKREKIKIDNGEEKKEEYEKEKEEIDKDEKGVGNFGKNVVKNDENEFILLIEEIKSNIKEKLLNEIFEIFYFYFKKYFWKKLNNYFLFFLSRNIDNNL